MPTEEGYQKSKFCLILTPFLTLQIFEIFRINWPEYWLVTWVGVKTQAGSQDAFSVRLKKEHNDKICTYCLQT